MTDFPNVPPVPLFINTWGRYGPGSEVARTGAALSGGSITWPVANTAFYMPVWLPWPYPVRRVWWVVGTANTSTNMDFGIYTYSGTKIYSTGLTAEGTVSTVQYVSPTEFLLAPGKYYFALAASTNTANCGGQGATTAGLPRYAMSGMLQQATALPLPATMTPVTIANACLPFCGITRTASGF